jgi:gliding motility-associated-like protein
LIRTLNGSGITADTSVSAGTNLTLNASGGIIYQWSPGQYLSNSNVSNPVLNVPVAGVYNYVVTITDAQGCSGTEDITVTVLPSDRLVIPDLITPNGDGMNDVWELDFLQNLTDYRVKIYSRGGILVWNTELYQNDWNGTHFQNGKILPDGTYYYLIQLSDGTEFKGPVTIKR